MSADRSAVGPAGPAGPAGPNHTVDIDRINRELEVELVRIGRLQADLDRVVAAFKEMQQMLRDAPRRFDDVLYSGFDAAALEKARNKVQDFQAWIAAHKGEFIALQMIYAGTRPLKISLQDLLGARLLCLPSARRSDRVSVCRGNGTLASPAQVRRAFPDARSGRQAPAR